jgi:hypothetical protein
MTSTFSNEFADIHAIYRFYDEDVNAEVEKYQ